MGNSAVTRVSRHPHVIAADDYGEYVISVIRNTTLTAAGCAALLLATTAACGTVENLTAAQKIDRASDKLGERTSLSVELGLDASPSALTKLAGSDDEVLPPEMAKALTKSRISISVRSKKPLADSGEKDIVGAALRMSGPQGVLAEYRLVGDHVYYRMDLKAFSGLAGMPAPTADDLPPGKDGEIFKNVLDGKWVKFKTDDIKKSAAAKNGAKKDEKASSGSLDSATQKKIMKAVRGALTGNVTLSDKGERNGAEHVTAKAPLRTLLSDLVDRLRPLTDELPEGAELPTAKDLKEVPDKKVAVDFAIKDGALSRVSMDVATLADDAHGAKVPLYLKFGEAGDVKAPAGATEIPVKELVTSGMFGMAGPGYSEEEFGSSGFDELDEDF
ncbi:MULTISPECIES: hypothetical protein [unclassified Streptomyces]|uniref:hypothetical protein n=1 Tax=unclassified Streptomyces TaxID=2593676 RepID=UPI0003692170|nr:MULTISPECIES: hypothetical protein [unclassified Streptomyces]